jgi:DnaJ-class molecular chaperone
MTENTNSNPEKIPSEEGSEGPKSLEILSDSELRAKYGTYGSRKAALSKREMMEALSRERFPWEE